MKRIFDPSFRYTPSYATDLRKTFERIRRELQPGKCNHQPAGSGAVRDHLRLARA